MAKKNIEDQPHLLLTRRTETLEYLMNALMEMRSRAEGRTVPFPAKLQLLQGKSPDDLSIVIFKRG
jgi:hypothetical protein